LKIHVNLLQHFDYPYFIVLTVITVTKLYHVKISIHIQKCCTDLHDWLYVFHAVARVGKCLRPDCLASMKLIIFVRFWISENPSSIWLYKKNVRLPTMNKLSKIWSSQSGVVEDSCYTLKQLLMFEGSVITDQSKWHNILQDLEYSQQPLFTTQM